MNKVYGDAVAARFWNKVHIGGPDDCWEWAASRDHHGYGQFNPGRGLRHSHASRFAWELANGPVDSGLDVCHKCDNPPCCNPAHLFPGTKSTNSLDSHRKGRRRHVKYARGERQGRARLTEELVHIIRALYKSGRSQYELARQFGVHRSCICGVVSGRTWGHVQNVKAAA